MIRRSDIGDATRYVQPGGIIPFLEEQYILPETRKLIVLEPWQKSKILEPLFCTLDEQGRRHYTLALIGLPKKHGKSTLAAGIGLYTMWCGEPAGEVIVAANSLDQAGLIIYNKIRRAVLLNPRLKAGATVRKDAIEVKSTGTVCRPIAHQAESAAGLNPTLVIFDELWGYPSRTFYDELTLSPSRREPLNLIVTYAGYELDSLLYTLYEEGLVGKVHEAMAQGVPFEEFAIQWDITPDRVQAIAHKEPDPSMFFLWEHDTLASWITEPYLEAQRRRMPQNVYLRFHENRWSSAADAFISEQDIDRLHSRPWTMQAKALDDPELVYCAGTDLGLRHDRAARAVVHYDSRQERFYLDSLRVWEGSPEKPVPIVEVERDLEECSYHYRARRLVVDPWQMEYVLQRLGGLYQAVPFNFSAERVGQMSQLLVRAIREGNLTLYSESMLDKELRAIVSRQTTRGWRIDHTRRTRNDCVMALGMAMFGIVEEMGGIAGTLAIPEEAAMVGSRPLFTGAQGEQAGIREEQAAGRSIWGRHF